MDGTTGNGCTPLSPQTTIEEYKNDPPWAVPCGPLRRWNPRKPPEFKQEYQRQLTQFRQEQSAKKAAKQEAQRAARQAERQQELPADKP